LQILSRRDKQYFKPKLYAKTFKANQMETTFKILKLKKQNFFQQLFGLHPKENAYIELNNLLSSKEFINISINDISNISSKYKVNLIKKFKNRLENLYSLALKRYLDDKKLSASEIENLKALKQILYLTSDQVEYIHNLVTGEIYKENYVEAVSDGRLSDEERHFLEKLQSDLFLPEELENKISDEVRSNYMNNFVGKILEDQQLSPDELAEMDAISKNLNFDVSLDKKSKTVLERFKLYWVLENGDIPTINTAINLQNGEVCYYKSEADWYLQKKVARKEKTGKSDGNARIMKGIYYKIGSAGTNAVAKKELKLLSTGTLYLTNKRLIFAVKEKESVIMLDKMLSFTPYFDGVCIEDVTGENPTLIIKDNIEMFCIIMSRLLREI
jgi:hypothetical protein